MKTDKAIRLLITGVIINQSSEDTAFESIKDLSNEIFNILKEESVIIIDDTTKGLENESTDTLIKPFINDQGKATPALQLLWDREGYLEDIKSARGTSEDVKELCNVEIKDINLTIKKILKD